MSRYSPTVLPDYGPTWAEQLAPALQSLTQGYLAGKDRRLAREERGADRMREDARYQTALEQQGQERAYQHTQDARTQEVQDVGLAQQGIRRGPAPIGQGSVMQGVGLGMDGPTVMPTAKPGTYDPVSRQFVSALTAPSAYTQLTPNYYRDNGEVAQQQQAKWSEQLAPILMRSQLEGQQQRDLVGLRSQYDAQQDARQHGYRLDEIGAQGAQARQSAALKPPGQPAVTDFEKRAALLAPRAEQAAAILATAKPLNWWDNAARHVPLIGSALMTDQGQQTNQAANQLATAIARMESGANVPTAEKNDYVNSFIASTGDAQGTQAQKDSARAIAVQRLHAAAGAALPPAPGEHRTMTQEAAQHAFAEAAAAYRRDLANKHDPAEARRKYDQIVAAIAAQHQGSR